jgi:hypothetical protein
MATKMETINDIISKGTFNEDRTIFDFTPIIYMSRNKEHTYSLKIKLLNGDNELLPITDSILKNTFDFTNF